MVKEAPEQGIPLQFVCEEIPDPEQAEAILIKELGTLAYGNLRRETDPADWA
jgi:hypothetical protein